MKVKAAAKEKSSYSLVLELAERSADLCKRGFESEADEYDKLLLKELKRIHIDDEEQRLSAEIMPSLLYGPW